MEERAGERRFPLSSILSPLVPRRERKKKRELRKLSVPALYYYP
jgi:hypothetical protein